MNSKSNGENGTPSRPKSRSYGRKKSRNVRGRRTSDRPPPDRRTFADAWDEVGYLYDKLLYWLYQRANRAKARPYARRLERLLPSADPGHDAIFGEECWSLVHEAKGDLPRAIESRENELRLIRRLYEVSLGKPYEESALKGYGYDDWSDRLDLLAILYHDSGALDKAITILQKSKKLCEAHGMEFDGEDLLQEYAEEKRNARQAAANAARPRSLAPSPRGGRGR
jgi:DNA polymerase III delta prime subunit